MALVLGPIVFTDYAIPESVSHGGAQALAVHKLLGGDRVVDAMGPDQSEIAWSGRFQGASASAQATSLDALRQSGIQVPLVFGLNFYLVVVSKVSLNFERTYQITYQISCTVVSSVGSILGQVVATLDDLVSTDISSIGADLSAFAGVTP